MLKSWGQRGLSPWCSKHVNVQNLPVLPAITRLCAFARHQHRNAPDQAWVLLTSPDALNNDLLGNDNAPLHNRHYFDNEFGKVG